MSKTSITVNSDETLCVYNCKDRVDQMVTGCNFGIYRGNAMYNFHFTPTERKILQYIYKNVNHTNNYIMMNHETFGLRQPHFSKAISTLKKIEFLVRVRTSNRPKMITKKNTFLINPFYLIPKYGHRASVADAWNVIANGFETNYVEQNKG